MKKIIAFIALCGVMAFTMPAQAQLKYGIKGGANFADLNIDGYKTNRATGWFAGPTAEFIMPIIGIGLDASLLYSRVSSEARIDNVDETYRLNYLSIPVNIRYKLQLPLIKPFVFAGPEICWKMSDNFSEVWSRLDEEGLSNPFRSKNAETKINLGGGVELMNKLEVFFNYNFAVTNTLKDVDSKSSIWRVGGTLYF